MVVPIFDPGALAAAIERLYRDPPLRKRMGQAARERIATDFRNEFTVQKTIELYRDLVPNEH
jgi:glycosyltransferase involved in cell wall biosynthesis